MESESRYRTRYCIRVPFPDEDLFCFVLDSRGDVAYYWNKADAEAEAKRYVDALIVENKLHG